MSLEHSPVKLAYGIADAVQATSVGRSKLYEEIQGWKAEDLQGRHPHLDCDRRFNGMACHLSVGQRGGRMK